jgi:hypothetical protein
MERRITKAIIAIIFCLIQISCVTNSSKPRTFEEAD